MFNGNMSMPSLSDIAAVTGNDKNNGWGDPCSFCAPEWVVDRQARPMLLY